MNRAWRVLDTGLRPAAQNIALDRALLEARQAGEIPSTLRFLRFAPCALLGSDQSAGQALNLDYCKANNITVQRRITSGGAVYTDETQLDWELYLHRTEAGGPDLPAIAKRICHAAATAISALGVDARYRPRNDIEVGGRRIARGGGVFDGAALLYQGTLQIDLDVAKTLSVLRHPAATLSDAAVASARTRMAGLNELLGRRADPGLIKRRMMEAFESEFEAEFHEGDLTLTEHARYRAALAAVDTHDWINLVKRPPSDAPICEAAHRYSGGILRVSLIYDRPRRRLLQIWFDGDVAARPRRTIVDLEAALYDTPLDRLEHNVRVFFAGRGADPPSPAPDDFIAVLRLAVGRPIVASSRA